MGGNLIQPPGHEAITPSRRSAWFTRFFSGYSARMLQKDFANVRLTVGSGAVLRSLEAHDGPAIVAMNHASWWDPLVGLVLARMFAPTRVLASPIEAEQLAKFRFMRRLGLFGIEPEHPGAMDAFVSHGVHLFDREPRTLLGLTPQGLFTDVRPSVRLRPGAGALAARLDGVRVAAATCEYVFWADRKPELLIHARPCREPTLHSTAGWTRALTETMELGRQELAALSIERDRSAFEPLFGRAGASVHPVYDLLLRLRGKRAAIDPAVRGGVDQHRRRETIA